ncbi:glutamate decarboxylase [Nocardia cyriacigeorgica]|uniref:Glutamate decarboxylase n=1 Tax=Nocardia cyriacigeorgica TaxID=135487 RepID=A0A6P1D2P4_9NOCA|nr:glutamate decarboxylase [Nocardia cyriacigeorgica]NEW38933.1 glutamate decarboxylase [Nocardia cyriacigeorgica]NEW43779.1 glutamate decarboxylase [Nocardia cyriacigeorgica]NEW50340.1 glutamate decarboxylase [Nocardia cyriacigeorgica]NEW54920.1 glutamate decarboxylase [Nocardia cyriacigeorgica]
MATSRDADDLFALPAFGRAAPKAGFPEPELLPQVAYEIVHDELALDGVSRMNLATFCTTWIDDQARRLMFESIDKNIVDKDEYPQTAELEHRAVRMVADLWHAPDPAATLGTSTIGSSEAAMLGGLAAKFRWRGRGGGTGVPNFVCGPVQVCWEKFARYFDVEIRQIPLRGDQYTMHPDDIAAHCDENTIMVVPTFGQTFTGLFEDVAGISKALDDIQASTGLDIPIHVDAASGGFLAPFTARELVWDFRLPRVKSINASGHKTGLAPLGVGWAIWREAADLPAELIFDVTYLGGSMATFNVNFSRPGGQAITQYYEFIRLGRLGYTRLQSAIYHVARHLAEGLAELGPFELIHAGDPNRGITAVSWRLTGDPGFNLYELSDRLRSRGWLIAAYPLPKNRDEEVIMRAVLRHGFTHDMVDLLLDDVRRGIDHLTVHPQSVPLTSHDAGGFTHDATPMVP